MKKLVLLFSFSYLLLFFYSFILLFFCSFVLLFFCSSLFLVGCKSDSINRPYIINPPTPTDTLGSVSGYINSIDGPIEDAYITLNNLTTFSDSNGFFEFKDCIKKNSVLTIAHPEFSDYSNSIIVTDTLNLNIALTRIKYDYFLLKVGNHWTYHWINNWYTSGGGSGQSAGTIDLHIVSVAGTYPNYLFKFNETRFDSSNNSVSEKYINIQTNNSDSIIVFDWSYIFRTSTIKRYYSVTSPDIFNIFGFENSTTKLTRNKGIIQFYYGTNNITFGSFKNIEIIDYTLN